MEERCSRCSSGRLQVAQKAVISMTTTLLTPNNVNDNFYFSLDLSLQTYSRLTNATYSENFSNGDFSLTTRTNYSGTGVNVILA